jgi:hypothetical protein
MSYAQHKRRGYWISKMIGGKKYRGRGPIYCPAGTTWGELKAEVEDIRKQGHFVRVEKTPVNKKDPVTSFGNTHTVWLWVRRRNAKE